MGKDGENLLLEGQQLREAGLTYDAVAKLNAAMAQFISDEDFARYAHALLDRAICWQHLYQETGDGIFVILFQSDAETMLKIAESKNLDSELFQAYFANGKANMLQKDYAQAVEFYRQAIGAMPAGHEAQKGDWLAHLGKAEYWAGQKEAGLKDTLDGIELIKKHMHELDSYTTNVWLSGGYLRLADTLKSNDKAASDRYLAEARKIIESDQTQIMRRKNLKRFEQTGEAGV